MAEPKDLPEIKRLAKRIPTQDSVYSMIEICERRALYNLEDKKDVDAPPNKIRFKSLLAIIRERKRKVWSLMSLKCM
jgi:hypothetical protein